MQIEIQIPKAVLFDVKYTVEQATNFAKKEVALGFYMQKGVSVALCSQIAGMSEKEFLVEVKDGGDAADQIVRYSMEGMEHGLIMHSDKDDLSFIENEYGNRAKDTMANYSHLLHLVLQENNWE